MDGEMLTLSTAEAGRFLHTAPSALRDTSVSAFAPSLLRGYLEWVFTGHSPVNATFMEVAYI